VATRSRRVQLRLTPEQHERLRALAEVRGCSLSALIREAIERVYFAEPAEGLGLEARLEAVRKMAALRMPVADWEQMEREATERPCHAR